MREFIDKNRSIAQKYYDIAENFSENNIKTTRNKLEKIRNEDPFYLDSYLLLAEVYEYENNQIESDKVLESAYRKALELILDKKGNWPDRLEWGWMENRHIIRTLISKAIYCWQCNDIDIALDLFENLLKTNPNDNGGVRYFILAIKEGMSEPEFNHKFDKGGYWGEEIIAWFDKNVEKYRDEFKWWLDLKQ